MHDKPNTDETFSKEDLDDELAFEMAYEKRLGETSVLSGINKHEVKKALIQSFFGVLTCFIVSLIYWRFLGYHSAFDVLASERSQVFTEHQYWRLLTALGVHSDLSHFMSNAVLFMVFAYLLRAYIGFLAYPVLSILSGVLTQYITLWTYPQGTVLIGASGMIYAMAGMWLSYYLRFENLHNKMVRLMRVLAFVLVVLMPSIIRPQVSYRAHAIGFGVGVIMAVFSFFMVKKNLLRKHRGIV